MKLWESIAVSAFLGGVLSLMAIGLLAVFGILLPRWCYAAGWTVLTLMFVLFGVIQEGVLKRKK